MCAQIVSCKGDSTHEWVEVAVSLDGKAVSLVDSKGYLWGGSSDFSVSTYISTVEYNFLLHTYVLYMYCSV